MFRVCLKGMMSIFGHLPLTSGIKDLTNHMVLYIIIQYFTNYKYVLFIVKESKEYRTYEA